jgi:hypothetical protein
MRFKCVSAIFGAVVCYSASLAALCGFLVESALVSFLRRCSKILLPIFWWPAAIKINALCWLGVSSFIFIVVRPEGFVGL